MKIKSNPWSQADIDRLCDLIAEDCHTFQHIADLMGRTRDSVTAQWGRIRKPWDVAEASTRG